MSDALADLDPMLYVRPPVLDVPGAIALGTALLSILDATMPVAVQQAAVRLQTAVLVLEQRWSEQREGQSGPDMDARTADLRLDFAWVAVGRRLEVLLDLPGHLPQAQDAYVLYRRLFPDELAFLNLPFRRQWARSELLLRIIDDEGLGPLLDPLVGGFVLDELRDAHEEYGRVLGIDDPKAALASPARMAEGLRELRDAIAVYGLQLVAMAHADPEAADAVRASLRPIANLRQGLPADDGLYVPGEEAFDTGDEQTEPEDDRVTADDDAAGSREDLVDDADTEAKEDQADAGSSSREDLVDDADTETNASHDALVTDDDDESSDSDPFDPEAIFAEPPVDAT